MTTRVRTAGRIGQLVGSDSESDLGGTESYGVARKRQGSVARSASHRVSKPQTKRAGSVDRRIPHRQSPRRPALTDKSNFNPTRVSHKSEKEKPFRFIDEDLSEEEDDFEAPRRTDMPKQRLEDSRPIKQAATAQRYASSSPQQLGRHYAQPDDDLEEDDMDMVDVVEEAAPVRQRSQPPAPVTSHIRPSSKSSNRPNSANQENATLQRQLREMTRKYENLEGRYTELREVGVKSAERNYEKLRKQSDENTTNANKLIAKLKEEIAAQRQASGDMDSVRMQLEDSQNNASILSNKVKDLTSSLQEAERQIKALNTKLAASRAPANTVPGSAVKGNGAKSWTGQSEMVHAAHAKEDLYADLTGLIIQGIKQNGTEDIFDCIQTGRNGTLHFKLGLEGSSSTVGYEKSMVTYSPQLQADRDADLIRRLPEYLRYEIEFKRPMVANFYSKVAMALKDKRASMGSEEAEG